MQPEFSYHATRDGPVIVSWKGRPVKTLRGREARAFLVRVATLDEAAAQRLMGRLTGNFKRGNERS